MLLIGYQKKRALTEASKRSDYRLLNALRYKLYYMFGIKIVCMFL